MTLRERIEQIAREAVSTHHPLVQTTEQMVERALIAILTDPAVGFKEALETIGTVPCAGDCVWAQKKLAELKELELSK